MLPSYTVPHATALNTTAQSQLFFIFGFRLTYLANFSSDLAICSLSCSCSASDTRRASHSWSYLYWSVRYAASTSIFSLSDSDFSLVRASTLLVKKKGGRGIISLNERSIKNKTRRIWVSRVSNGLNFKQKLNSANFLVHQMTRRYDSCTFFFFFSYFNAWFSQFSALPK